MKKLFALPAALLLVVFATGCDDSDFTDTDVPEVFPVEARGLWSANPTDSVTVGGQTVGTAELQVNTASITLCQDYDVDGAAFDRVNGRLESVNGNTYELETSVDSIRNAGVEIPDVTVDAAAGEISVGGDTYAPEPGASVLCQ